MTPDSCSRWALLIGRLLAPGVAALIAPHSLYEHLKAGFSRETGEADRADVAQPS